VAKEVVVNFKGADPVSGGRRFDRIPEGTYLLKCVKAEGFKTRTKKDALSVTMQVDKGPYQGKKVADIFVIPRVGTTDAIFPVQRLHGLMVACGVSRQSGKVMLSKIARVLKGRSCVAEVVDSVLPETDDNKERTVSSPVAYFSAKSKEGVAALKPPKAVEEEEEEEEEGEEEEEEEEKEEEEKESDEDEDEEEEEEPARKSSKTAAASKKSAKKSRKSSDEDEEEEDEDLYDEDEDEDEE